MVAQVANDLATQFIDENLKAREQQSTGTTEFLQNQLQETKKVLEAQEAKLKEFKLKHLGEMPEQQSANLQILGQLQSQLQLESEALARAEQQRSTIQVLMPQSAPVVDLDEPELKPSGTAAAVKPAQKESPLVSSQSPAHSIAAALWGPASGHTEAEGADRGRGSERGSREGGVGRGCCGGCSQRTETR